MNTAYIPKITVKSYPKEIHPFILFIRKLYKINKWVDIEKLKITFDYDAKDVAGFYMPSDKHKLYINPSNCIHNHRTEFSESMVLVHEFCHMVDSYYNLLEQWEKFEPIHINRNSKKNREEELAEHMTIYLLDYKLYWKLSPKRYKFLKKYVKAPRKSKIILPDTMINGCLKHITNQ